MRFTKMQGIGNDYVYVDCFAQPTPSDPAALAKKISDRHFGVGSDGLILICPSTVADARMRMFNADGTESEMCGNGVRCVAKFVYEHGIAKKPTLKIETGNGVLALEVEAAGGLVQRVKVDMGEPILEAEKIPVNLSALGKSERVVDLPLEKVEAMPADLWDHLVNGDEDTDCRLDPRITCVSMGNPHAILYCGDVAEVNLKAIGPFLEHQPVFPKRINVHFVQVHSKGEVTMRTWERGSGITLACGTGASAVCVAGVLTGRSDRKILAHLPGGDLELEWALDNHVYMTGPATEVFSGEWPG